MKWRRGQKNPDVIDQRGGGGGGGAGGAGGGAGGGLPIPIPSSGAGKGAGGLGIVGVIIFLVLQFLVGGGGGGGFDIPSSIPSNAQAPSSGEPIPPSQDPQADLKDFSSYVHADTQKFWETTFQQAGTPYNRAKLVLYSGGVDTGCGSATSAVGPFYCPVDERVYLDLSFYEDMTKQLGAPGDFAWAYVIAHEMGHHIQQQDGTFDKVQQEEQANPDDANAISVRTELQADCYAGIWGKTVFAAGDLEQGDIEEAQNAAAAVGDDRLQSRGGGGVDPDSFTHGTSEQRQHWFQTGYDSGQPSSCDTFSPDSV
ncbi:MAG: KPN_02809 family neutral zinc metallopeptidase [Solirubrobacterales bacterium]